VQANFSDKKWGSSLKPEFFPVAHTPRFLHYLGVTQQYAFILLQLGAAIVIAVGALVTSLILGKRGRRSKAKDTAYECGMDPRGSASARFSVKFYLVAMLFILFDIEVVFLYPWAVSLREGLAGGWNYLWVMGAFVAILLVGFIYELKKGALDWK